MLANGFTVNYAGHETCDASSDCDRSSVRKSGRLCVYPAPFNGTSLLRLFIVGSSKPVLFIGSVDEVYLVYVLTLLFQFNAL